MWNSLISAYFRQRLSRIRRVCSAPVELQQLWFQSLLRASAQTRWGQKYKYATIDTINQFQETVPVSTYETYYPWIEKVLSGEKNVLWPGKVTWFAKSSGTTNDRSKFIPVTPESLHDNHFRAGKDLFAQYYENNPGSKMASGKNLVIGGSHELNLLNNGSRYGDLSAVLIENLPFFYTLFRTPSKEITLMGEWETKLEAISRAVQYENITSMTGVPTWLLVLFNRLFEMQGIEDRNLLRIWPALEVFFHGAVAFGPYKSQFERMIPGGQMHYMETYNASEGFFAFQDDLTRPDLLLLLDHGIFYEFVPLEEIEQAHPVALTLDQVELHKNYALVISTNGGLWRYMPGDTVRFTSLYPFRILISGRTRHFINAFGEELIMDHAETAVLAACRATGAEVSNYTAGPVYVEGNRQGGHEWIFEFLHAPDSSESFGRILDETLQTINSDYAAKRYQDIAMLPPRIRTVPEGTFYAWMKSRGKLGGQHKVPRLSNSREYLDQISSSL